MIDVEFLLESGNEINVYGDSSEAFLHLANPKDEYHFFCARINKQESIRIIAALSDIFGLEMRSMRSMSEIVKDAVEYIKNQSPEERRAAFIRSGIIGEDGKLTENYTIKRREK